MGFSPPMETGRRSGLKTKQATSKQMVPQREIHYTQAADSVMTGKDLLHLVLVDPQEFFKQHSIFVHGKCKHLRFIQNLLSDLQKCNWIQRIRYPML